MGKPNYGRVGQVLRAVDATDLHLWAAEEPRRARRPRGGQEATGTVQFKVGAPTCPDVALLAELLSLPARSDGKVCTLITRRLSANSAATSDRASPGLPDLPPAGKDIEIVSVDAVKAGMEALAAGKINCIVECAPLLGEQLFQAVGGVLDGKEIPVRVITIEGASTRSRPRRLCPPASTESGWGGSALT